MSKVFVSFKKYEDEKMKMMGENKNKILSIKENSIT